MMLFNYLHQKDVVKCFIYSYNERNENTYESYVYEGGTLLVDGINSGMDWGMD